MDAIRIDIDVGVFSPDVISRAAHHYTGDFFVELRLSAPSCFVELTPKCANLDVANVALRFGNDLLDERLRSVIREQTADLQLTLVKAALREASPDALEVAP